MMPRVRPGVLEVRASAWRAANRFSRVDFPTLDLPAMATSGGPAGGIAALLQQRTAALEAAGHRLAFYEASLLVETGRHRLLDGLVVVDAPEAERIARVVARDGVTPAEVRARIAAQLPLEQKRRVAT